MKSIINSLLAVFIFGIIATGFSYKPETTHRILIQSTENSISPADLSRSAEIISNRLKSFSTEKFEVSTIPGKNQIQVTLSRNWDQKIAEKLLTQKGALGFYETFTYKDVTELLKGDSVLLSLLNGNAPGGSNARIGCTSPEGINKVEKYVNSAGLDHICKFAWDNTFDESEICLFALKLVDGKGAIMSGADIESFKIRHDSTRKQDYFDFSFKKPAIQLWANITKRNIDKAIAIVLDGNVIYAPVVSDQITGGNCTVSGGFTAEQVKYIVVIGGNGELPVSFRTIN